MGAEEDAAARRERLRALRAAKELLSAPDGEQQNGNHVAEEQVEQPALPVPQDAAPDEDAKENVSPAEADEEAEDDG
ncbi:hypothetical protein EJB05_40867 [Eragrostis curvula]|uniref:Uncharacterized protein n=1 Tax=Eragrostis curvula TaxID=38414 RepID=A0A5J9TAB1_9POAL|nr:hypothetical protein EJB05_40867 [Eragrostis curvula]